MSCEIAEDNLYAGTIRNRQGGSAQVMASGLSQGRCLRALALAAALAGGCAGAHKAPPEPVLPEARAGGLTHWHFDNAKPGRPPVGWSISQTNPTRSLATWEVAVDESAPSRPNVLALMESENYNGTFNLAIADRSAFKDLDLTVRARAVRGEIDQGGGPIWRCKDENNYYICRFNPLESNYRVYKVVDGKRKQLDSARVELQVGRWYALRVTMVGSRILCYLDGELMLEATDDAFTEGGMVGLWTKADAVTSFDDLAVRALQ